MTTRENIIMTELNVQAATRRFQMGCLELPDPAPGLPPEEAVRLLAVNFPQCASGLLGAPECRDGVWVYPIDKPPVKTNG